MTCKHSLAENFFEVLRTFCDLAKYCFTRSSGTPRHYKNVGSNKGHAPLNVQYSRVVICAAKYLNLQFPTNLITQRSVVQIHPPQPTLRLSVPETWVTERSGDSFSAPASAKVLPRGLIFSNLMEFSSGCFPLPLVGQRRRAEGW
jgi:hypothetical protein